MSHRYDSSIYSTFNKARETTAVSCTRPKDSYSFPKPKPKRERFISRESEAIDGRHIIIIHTTRRRPFRRRRTRHVPLRRRAHRASHPSCTTPTAPKQTNVTLHPAADGSTRITSPRILTSASAFAGTSPPRRRRSALVGSPSRTTSCALSLFQSLMVSSIDK